MQVDALLLDELDPPTDFGPRQLAAVRIVQQRYHSRLPVHLVGRLEPAASGPPPPGSRRGGQGKVFRGR